jgi:DNA polymerase III subunit gamma/tau
LFKSGLSSIDKLKQQIAERKKEQANQPAETERSEEPAPLLEHNTPVTQEGFANTWDKYLMQLQKENKMSLSVIFKNASWSLLNDSGIELVLASQHERELFEEERINIIPYMRKNLKHTGFDIQIRVNSAIRKTRVFTAEEKFNAMAEKNPLLNDLRNLLALDLEY